MKTPAKEAKYDVNVEKKEPFVVVPQTDEVSHASSTRERICKLLPRDIQFCVHMIEKYGEDYEVVSLLITFQLVQKIIFTTPS